MARDRQRAKQRRRRQDAGGAAAAARSAARTRKARDVGLDDASVDDAGLDDPTSAPGPLEHSSADVDQAKLAEAGAVPPEVGDADSDYDGDFDAFDEAGRAPDEAEED